MTFYVMLIFDIKTLIGGPKSVGKKQTSTERITYNIMHSNAYPGFKNIHIFISNCVIN